jgi:hypothetical protein
MKSVLAAAAAVMILAGPAGAQELDFGVWCSDIARFNADRCAEQRPEDKSAYDRYAANVHGFESELLRKQEADRIMRERVNRMGDVTQDQTRDNALGR